MSLSIISAAYAAPTTAATPNAQAGGMSSVIMLAVFFAVFYFLLWRPQAKRAKEQRALLAGLTKGDEVVTSGGLVGRIAKVNDSFIQLTVAEGIELTIQRTAIAATLPKGTLKSAE